jgi:hypothetical protein
MCICLCGQHGGTYNHVFNLTIVEVCNLEYILHTLWILSGFS